ncbi:MAG: LeuA family protein [Myxococcota bacterium]
MKELIHDWNPKVLKKAPELCDETLRDGLQSPSVLEPDVDASCQLLSMMDKLGITIADIGLPGAGERAAGKALELAKYVVQQKLSMKIYCAGRTVEADIKPIADIQNAAGIPIAAYCFLGTSPIRQAVENWDIDMLLKTAEKAIRFAISQNLEVAFVTEDTTRSSPETLSVLFKQAINMGVKRLVLCDTVGHSTPEGVVNLVTWAHKLAGDQIALDWHGHNDRGLGLINSLVAAQAGCSRIHGTGLGVGERVGNTAMDQIIINLKLAGVYEHDVSSLGNYVNLVSKACGVPIPYNYPVFGKDAFRTATGVHAAAVIKAEKRGEEGWADLVYSSVPARHFGQKQIIEVGPMSGLSNVHYWLSQNKINATESQVAKIFELAKSSNHILTDSEIRGCL